MTPEKLAEGKRLVEEFRATSAASMGMPHPTAVAADRAYVALRSWLIDHAPALLAAEERAQAAERVAVDQRECLLRAYADVAAAERERDEARKVLREFEWEAIAETIPDYDRPSIVECRVCHGRRDNGGHEAGCRVDRALGGGK